MGLKKIGIRESLKNIIDGLNNIPIEPLIQMIKFFDDRMPLFQVTRSQLSYGTMAPYPNLETG